VHFLLNFISSSCLSKLISLILYFITTTFHPESKPFRNGGEQYKKRPGLLLSHSQWIKSDDKYPFLSPSNYTSSLIFCESKNSAGECICVGKNDTEYEKNVYVHLFCLRPCVIYRNMNIFSTRRGEKEWK
jgi:hypothetical protein